MIKNYLTILKAKNLFQYRNFYSKWGKEIPFINEKIYYMYKPFIIVLTYILLIATFYLFQYVFKLNLLNYFYVIFLVVFSIHLIFYYSKIEYYNNQFKFISFIKSGLFSKGEIIRNTDMIITYDLINLIAVMCITFFTYFSLKYNIYKNINVNEIFLCINIFLTLTCIAIKKINTSYKIYILDKSLKYNSNYILLLILLILYIFIRLYNVKLVLNYSLINYLSNLNNLYVRSIEFINKFNTYFFNIFFLVINLLNYTLFIISKNHVNYNNKQYYSNINIWISDVLEKDHSINKDFFQKEIKNKLIFMCILIIIIYIVKISLLRKTILISFCVTFLFTQYNQRYLLSDSFLNYMKLFNSKDKLLYSINKELIKIELVIAAVFILSIQNLTLLSFVYILIGISFFLVNIIINTFIYNNGLNLQYSNTEKINLIEKISGIFYVVELLLILFL
jgi:hypothetical protein